MESNPLPKPRKFGSFSLSKVPDSLCNVVLLLRNGIWLIFIYVLIGDLSCNVKDVDVLVIGGNLTGTNDSGSFLILSNPLKLLTPSLPRPFLKVKSNGNMPFSLELSIRYFRKLRNLL